MFNIQFNNKNKMAKEKDNFKILVTIAIASIGGLLLGRYLWGTKQGEDVLSKQKDTLKNVLKKIDNLEDEDAINLKNKIQSILKSIESAYVGDK